MYNVLVLWIYTIANHVFAPIWEVTLCVYAGLRSAVAMLLRIAFQLAFVNPKDKGEHLHHTPSAILLSLLFSVPKFSAISKHCRVELTGRMPPHGFYITHIPGTNDNRNEFSGNLLNSSILKTNASYPSCICVRPNFGS